MSPEDNVFNILRQTLEPYTRNLVVLLAVCAAMVIIPGLVIGIPFCGLGFVVCLMTHEKMPFLIFPIALLGGLVFAVGYNLFRAGWTKILLEVVDNGEASFSNFTEALPQVVNFTLCCMLVSAATAIGLIFLVVPAVFIAVRLAFAPFLVIDENLGPIEACMRSNELVTGYSWQILLYLVLLSVSNFIAGLIVGWIPVLGMILGPVATVPVISYFELALANIYRSRNSFNR